MLGGRNLESFETIQLFHFRYVLVACLHVHRDRNDRISEFEDFEMLRDIFWLLVLFETRLVSDVVSLDSRLIKQF